TIAATPGNAITLETMERDYEVIRTQYDEAVNDLAQAQTGDTIEVLAKGQRIEVIEPAIPPASPESPNRKLIAAGGVVMGGMLGLSLVVLLELLNSSVRRPADLRRGLGIEPFGTLPLIQTPGQIRLRRAKIMLAFLAVAVVVPAGLWWVHTEVTPLDRLIDRALDEIGV
ncbi:MAG: lipopolysaccharide biosynthesis protein, partial [Pseudomonadota bacterium]